MNLYTAEQAGEQLGVSDSQMRRLAVIYGVGRRVGRAWLFSDEDIETLRERQTRRGPRTKTTPQDES